MGFLKFIEFAINIYVLIINISVISLLFVLFKPVLLEEFEKSDTFVEFPKKKKYEKWFF